MAGKPTEKYGEKRGKMNEEDAWNRHETNKSRLTRKSKRQTNQNLELQFKASQNIIKKISVIFNVAVLVVAKPARDPNGSERQPYRN